MKKIATLFGFLFLIPAVFLWLPDSISGQDKGSNFQWMNDLHRARIKAKKTGKPLLVHFR